MCVKHERHAGKEEGNETETSIEADHASLGIFTPFPLVFFINGLLRKKLSFERISLVSKYGTYPALDLLFSDLASLGHGSAVTIFEKNYLLKEFRLCLKMEPILL